jgi:prepilin-type N-terminal cleavage/methylation domain-containing protein
MAAKEERGFTLSELLVAMTLGLIVLFGVYSFYATSMPAYGLQDQLLETQQNLRIALELLVEDLQRAGGTGIPSVVTVDVTNSSTSSDSLRLLIPEAACPPTQPQVIPIVTYNGAGGSMTLSSGSTCTGMVGKVGIAVTANGLDYRTVQITTVTTTTDTINFSSGVSPLYSTNGPTANYASGTLALVRKVEYTVDLTDPAKPLLKRNLSDGAGALPLANYIEDMQVSLGYDRNGDGIITEVGIAANDDEWVFNVAGESNAGEAPTNLKEVRIVLVGRTRLANATFQGALPAVLDRAQGGPDGYRRKIKGTKVKIRNL